MNRPSMLDNLISNATGERFVGRRLSGAVGGCINETFVYGTGQRRYFVKRNSVERREMFQAEADGLRELANTKAIRVPGVVAVGEAGGSVLVLEYIDLAPTNAEVLTRLGEQLARMHAATAERFGWFRDNTIGSTPQINDPTDSWPMFFTEHRLRRQFAWAAEAGFAGLRDGPGSRLLESVGAS